MTNIAENEQGLAAFLERNRRALFVCFVVIAAACVGFVAAMIISEELNKRAIAEFEPLIERYESVLKSKEYAALTQTDAGDAADEEASDGGDAAAEPAQSNAQAETINNFLAAITAFAEKQSGYPGAAAWSMAAHLLAKQSKWSDAEAAYTASANAGKKTHLAPVSLFNAAVCAEEQSKREDAIAHYTNALSYADFPQAPHAQFSIGRLHEEAGSTDAAIEAYQALIDKYPKAESWTALAHRQIIALELTR